MLIDAEECENIPTDVNCYPHFSLKIESIASMITNVLLRETSLRYKQKKTGVSACFSVTERETGFEPATLSLGS